MLELSNFCHCVQHPWKLTGRDFWSSRNERKPLSKLQHVLRKCSRVSQKWWVLELSNVCHCDSTPENLLVEISGAPGTKESHLLSKTCFQNMQWSMSEWWVLELSNLCHCVQHPWKCTGRDFWSSRNERKPLSKLQHVLRKCCGTLRNGEC